MDDIEHPTETPEQRAKRMWGNHDLTKRFLDERRKPRPIVKVNPDIAGVIQNERIIPEATTKFERQFIKDLRQMLDEHTQRNLLRYRMALRTRIHRLKQEKLKRLLAQREAQQSQLAQPKTKDLFSC